MTEGTHSSVSFYSFLLGQQEWGLGEKYGVWSRGPAGVLFLDWTAIFSYWGLSRGPVGVALI